MILPALSSDRYSAKLVSQEAGNETTAKPHSLECGSVVGRNTTCNSYLGVEIICVVLCICLVPVASQLLQMWYTLFSEGWWKSSQMWLTYSGTSLDVAPRFFNHAFAALMVWFQHCKRLELGRNCPMALRMPLSSSTTIGILRFPFRSAGTFEPTISISSSWIRNTAGITGEFSKAMCRTREMIRRSPQAEKWCHMTVVVVKET